MENKNQKIGLIIILSTVLFLAIIFIGMTYAFFTANNPEGSTAEIKSETGRMLITYNDGTDNIVPATNIQPSNAILVDKTFTLTGSNTTVGMKTGDGLEMPYKVGVQYTSTFSDGMMHYYIKEVNRPANSNVTANYVITPETGKTELYYINQTVPGNETYTGYTHGTFKNGSKYTEMVTGIFPASLNDQTITFNLIIQFPDNNENQDSEKGKTFNGKVVINYEPKYISTYLTKLDKTENGLEEDKTTDKNLRYVGASPRNYLKFNGDEIWRIVGVFNNITTIDKEGKEKKESLVKIVRNDSLGDYSWDSSESSTNNGFGVNEWSKADLMYELNCDGSENSKYCRDDITEGYLSNLTSGTTYWYNGTNNAKNGTYNYNNNIRSLSIDKVAKVRWNTSRATYNTSVLDIYNQERSTTPINTPKDNVPRNNTWDGKIALIYPSDYGYASTNEACRNKMNPSLGEKYICKNENWLFNSKYQLTLSPKSGAEYVFLVYSDGDGSDLAYRTFGVRPALFLKSDSVIESGTGTSNDPFVLK